jgi:membrane associated rhomboid family serine protease
MDAQRRSDRREGILLVLGLATIMWLVEVVDRVLGGRLDRYGIEPHDVDGLAGIVAAPFLHAGWSHLIGNTIPFLALGAVIALSGVARVAAVTVIVAVVAGLGTWLVAPAGTDHIGASGIVVGYASYLIARGAFSRRPLHLVAGLVVLAVYGATLLVSLVPADGISWQGHLFGAVGGVVAARALDARQATADPRRAALSA